MEYRWQNLVSTICTNCINYHFRLMLPLFWTKANCWVLRESENRYNTQHMNIDLGRDNNVGSSNFLYIPKMDIRLLAGLSFFLASPAGLCASVEQNQTNMLWNRHTSKTFNGMVDLELCFHPHWHCQQCQEELWKQENERLKVMNVS